MNMIKKVIKGFKQLNRISLGIIYHGLQLSCGLLVLAYIFDLLVGRYGDAMTAFACAQGALEAAPMVATFSFAGGLIFDLARRDRENRNA